MQSFIEFFEGVEVPKSPEPSAVQRRRLVAELGEIIERLSNGGNPNDRDRQLLVIARAVLFCLNRR